jgi:gliding motility-associated-like protein
MATLFSFFVVLVMFGFSDLSACDSTNPTCDEAIDLPELDLTGSSECLLGCADGNAQGRFDENAACSGSPFATSWYRISPGTVDRVFDLELNSIELSHIVVTLYQGDCSAFTALDCNTGKSRSVNLRNVLLEAGATYYIAVSSLDGAEGSFDLCYSYGPDENQCNKQPSIAILSTSLGSSLSGPFKPNEEVEICYTISGFENNGCNYLQGIVPIFGEGWSADSFNPDGSPKQLTVPLQTQGHTSFTTSNPVCEGDPAGTWNWYVPGDLSYNLNSANPMAYRFGDDIDAGWVFLNSFDPTCFEFDDACCVNPTADPNQSFGDDNYPICGSGLDHEWTVCMKLTTATPSDCSVATDCMVGFKSFADGELGAFRSNDCSKDRVTYFNASVDCCTAPSVSAAQTQINLCPQQTMTLSLDVDDTSARLFWIDELGGINLLDPASRELDITAPDTGTQIYKIYAANGCNSDPLIIEVGTSVPSEIWMEGSSSICEGERAFLQLSLTGIAPWTVELRDDAGELYTLIIDEPTYTETYTPVDDFVLTIESATDGNGCAAEWNGTFEVSLGAVPQVETTEEVIKYCNQEVDLVVVSMVAGADYRYDWADATGASLGQGDNITIDNAGAYTLSVTDNDTGCQTTRQVMVTDNPDDLQITILNGNSVDLSEGSSVVLEVVTNLEEDDIVSILWEGPVGLDCYDCSTPIASVTEDATYTVSVQDIYGCVVIRAVDIVITDKIAPAKALYIPTAFQPNSADESTFCVFDNGQSQALISMEVYDRWGSVVFSVHDVSVAESCWDGTQGGQLLEQGVYVYKLAVQYPGETETFQSGSLTLLR